jgi:hypothetical protein
LSRIALIAGLEPEVKYNASDAMIEVYLTGHQFLLMAIVSDHRYKKSVQYTLAFSSASINISPSGTNTGLFDQQPVAQSSFLWLLL